LSKPADQEVAPIDAAATTKSTILVDEVEEPAQTKEATSLPDEKDSLAPEKYELKLPEGSGLKPRRIDEIAALAKQDGLSNDAAQALLDYESEAHAAWMENQKSELAAKSQEWFRAAESDPEFGGAQFKQSAELAKSVINKFGSDSLKKALVESGLGNHPELIRVFSKIGKAMAPDTLVMGGGSAPPDKSMAEIFYPEMTGKS
jgi:hypothetical protein